MHGTIQLDNSWCNQITHSYLAHGYLSWHSRITGAQLCSENSAPSQFCIWVWLPHSALKRIPLFLLLLVWACAGSVGGSGLGQGCQACTHVPLFASPGSLLVADMDECPSLPSIAAPEAEPGVTEQPGPRSPPPSPPGIEVPLDGANPDPDVPHPDLAPVAFFCLRQTTSPRNWCIKMVCNPYPWPYGAGPGWGWGDCSWRSLRSRRRLQSAVVSKLRV